MCVWKLCEGWRETWLQMHKQWRSSWQMKRFTVSASVSWVYRCKRRFFLCAFPPAHTKTPKNREIGGEYTKVGNSEFYLVKWHRVNFTVAPVADWRTLPHQDPIGVMYRLYRRGWSEIERVCLKWGWWVPALWGAGEIEGGNREQTESIWGSGHLGMMRARSHW
jgi:hypothetical protein